MAEFAFFLGCGIPSSENNYELATRRVFEKIGAQLCYMPGAGCCGHDLEQVDRATFLAWAARNLTIAEGMEKDVMVLCPSCYLTLMGVNSCLRNNEADRKTTNELLAHVDAFFQGSVNVIHYVDFLLREDVFNRLCGHFSRFFQGMKVGVHYGCHLLRPSRVLNFDNPVTPTKIDLLVKATGADSVDYPDKTMCCGSSILGTDMRASLAMASSKLATVKNAGLDIMITACPVCHNMYDDKQTMMNKLLKTDHRVPVLHLTQLLGLAMGLNIREVGLHKNKGGTDKIVELFS
jgi:heterodisulfide reductase subunit B2